jgi:hypothetical protein
MASDTSMRWPSEYIDDVLPITRTFFDRSLRAYRPARESLSLLAEKDIEQLYRETCEFLKERDGSRQMRAARVPQDLERCDRLIRTEGNLSELFLIIERSANHATPFTSGYSREVLERTRMLISEINEKWLDNLRNQRVLISKMITKNSRVGFTRNVEAYLSRLLKKKKHNGRRLRKKTRQMHLVSLVGAVMAGAREPMSDHPHDPTNRIRQQRSNARRASGYIADEEVFNYIQVGREYLEKLKKKKQKGRRISQK